MEAPIRPNVQRNIMDVVIDAGIDVSDWSRTKKGEPVKHPAANPQFCYEWVFGGGNDDILFCIWYERIDSKDGVFFIEDNMREQREISTGLLKKAVF
jgi:hypothetical protein